MQNTDTSIFGDNKYNPLEERLLLRPLSRPIAFFLNKYTKITPDQVSLLGFVVTIITSYFITTSVISTISIILLYISNILDKVDGDLARVKKIASTQGQYIDGFLDVLGDFALIASWSIAFGFGVHPILILLSCVSTAIFNYHGLASPFYLNTKPNTHKQKQELTFFNKVAMNFGYGRARLFFLMIVLLIINKQELLFFILPLLILYTCMLYLRNIFIKKLTQRV